MEKDPGYLVYPRPFFRLIQEKKSFEYAEFYGILTLYSGIGSPITRRDIHNEC